MFIITTLPDREHAVKMAEALVERHLAACVHCLAAGTSVYRWQGKMVHAEEVTLLIKSIEARYGELEVAIRSLHPYELPEIVALPIKQGLPGYLEWIENECK